MKPTAMGLAVVVAVAATVSWAAPFQSSQVADTARWVVHADVEGLKITQVGTYVWNLMNEGNAANKLGAFSALLGFDPRKDVNSVTLYGKSKDPSQSVALLSGTFNQDHLVALLKGNDSYEALSNGTGTIHSWVDDKKPAEGRQYGCFHGTNQMLISRGLDMLKESLDVLDGRHPALRDARVFGDALPVQAPFFIAGADMSEAGAINPGVQMLTQAQSGQMALSEQTGILNLSIQLVTRDATSASNIQSVAQGMLAIAQLGAQQDPGMAQLAQAAKISVAGTTVRMDLACPAQQAIALIAEGIAKQAALRQATPSGQ
jgi:hypothetical protein